MAVVLDPNSRQRIRNMPLISDKRDAYFMGLQRIAMNCNFDRLNWTTPRNEAARSKEYLLYDFESGFVIRPNKGCGNCQFLALKHAWGLKDKKQQVRENAVSVLTREELMFAETELDPNEITTLVAMKELDNDMYDTVDSPLGLLTVNFSRVKRYLMRDTVWGGFVTLIGAARFYKKTVVVVEKSESGDMKRRNYVDGKEARQPGNEVPDGFIYYTGSHFEAMLPISTYVAS